MIRSVRIPTGVSRMGSAPGSIGFGAGGNATSYTFDSTGLSNDPQLAPYLQSLTPSQLQHALDDDVAASGQDLRDLLNQDQNATGAGWLPCGTADSGDPTCSGFAASSGIPTWLLWGGVALGGVLILRTVTR